MPVMIDAHAATKHAVDLLLKKLQNKKFKVSTLRQFLFNAKQETLTRAEKELICDQAIIVLEQFYAHLPFKRALYAVDPIQRLKLLRAALSDADAVDDLSFHAGVTGVFTSLRDVHTVYCLPKPFAGTVAFLPFFVDHYQSRDGARRFVVTRMLDGFDPDPGYFCRFSEITAWNGVAIARAVDQLAQAIPGGNQATRAMRGTMRLSARQLTTTSPPMEDVVYVQYRPYRTASGSDEMGKPIDVEERVIAVPWHVGEGLDLATLDHSAEATKSQASPSASCIQLSDFVNLRRMISASKPGKEIPTVPADRVGFPELTFPDVFDVHHSGDEDWAHLLTAPKYPRKRFGYIRIRRFPDTLSEESINDFESILQWFTQRDLATDGLLLDIHSNPGGNIIEAESMLQLLSPKPIKPARFHYPNTEAIQNILASVSSPDRIDATTNRLPASQSLCVSTAADLFVAWGDGVLDGAGSGSALTDGRPLTNAEKANERGQVYHGPIVLLTDACTYSAADIFAGGFQDHRIGIVIGVDKNTGGGGASSWRHAKELLHLQPLTGLPIKRLPKHAAFGLAIQRSVRVKEFNGHPVEDRGVKSDIHYKRTFEDVLHDSKHLMRFACGVLAEKPVYKLSMLDEIEYTAEGVNVTVKASTNFNKLVFQLDDHPALIMQLTAKPADKNEETTVIERTYSIPIDDEEGQHWPRKIEVQGFVWRRTATGRNLEVVARSRKPLKYLKLLKSKTAAR